jgi:hypothetical protein
LLAMGCGMSIDIRATWMKGGMGSGDVGHSLRNGRTLRKDLPEERSTRGWRNIAISTTRRYSER